MSYVLEKDNDKGNLVENWIPYKPMEFEKGDMPLRQEQLGLRVRECKQTLDLLSKLNDGVNVDHVLHSTMNFDLFKVYCNIQMEVYECNFDVLKF